MIRTHSIAIFGSSLVSSYWNGAATYYRGIIRALDQRGHRITFYEPDAMGRQERRDIHDPPWARVVVVPPTESAIKTAVASARNHDVVIKASGIGVFDVLLETEVLKLQSPSCRVGFWDQDAPGTLERLRTEGRAPFRALVPRYDFVFTYGGGESVARTYLALGARACVPIGNAVDPNTHHPAPPDPRFACDVAFLDNRNADREQRIEEFFLQPAALLPNYRFLLGGSGWEGRSLPANVRSLGHVPTSDHNAFNATPLAVVNVSREHAGRHGHAPASRVFEAAGAGACIVTDRREGVDRFLRPGREVLVAANGREVVEHVLRLDTERAAEIGRAARRRVLADHTYARRAAEFEAQLHACCGALEVTG